jgi:hypothetical protein
LVGYKVPSSEIQQPDFVTMEDLFAYGVRAYAQGAACLVGTWFNL